MDPLWQISIDLLLILRLLGSFIWGWVWALFIYKTRDGITLRLDHTWVTVVIGVGLDLIISFPQNWFIVAAAIASSSIGILYFAAFDTHKNERPTGYKVIEAIENATAIGLRVIRGLETILTCCEDGKTSAAISKVLTDAQREHFYLATARNGDFTKRRKETKE